MQCLSSRNEKEITPAKHPNSELQRTPLCGSYDVDHRMWIDDINVELTRTPLYNGHGESHATPTTLAPSHPMPCCLGAFFLPRSEHTDAIVSGWRQSIRLRSSAGGRLDAGRTAAGTPLRGRHSRLRSIGGVVMKSSVAARVVGDALLLSSAIVAAVHFREITADIHVTVVGVGVHL